MLIHNVCSNDPPMTFFEKYTPSMMSFSVIMHPLSPFKKGISMLVYEATIFVVYRMPRRSIFAGYEGDQPIILYVTHSLSVMVFGIYLCNPKGKSNSFWYHSRVRGVARGCRSVGRALDTGADGHGIEFPIAFRELFRGLQP